MPIDEVLGSAEGEQDLDPGLRVFFFWIFIVLFEEVLFSEVRSDRILRDSISWITVVNPEETFFGR